MPPGFEQLAKRASEWNVAIAEFRESETSLVAFGVWNGAEVVLKVNKYSGDEWNAGEVLRAYQSAGTVRVYKSDGGAVLLERIRPGTELVDLVRRGGDEQATEIFADVIARMRDHDPPPGSPTVFDWARAFDRYLQGPDSGSIRINVVEEARKTYLGLAASQNRTTLLHGDLHHYNVLLDEKRGWVAIDPKGVVGELEYELGAIIRNPIELPELYSTHEVVERRLFTLTRMLDLDYRRALAWSFAQAVLSAIWDVEDGYEVTPTHQALQLAGVTGSMLR